MTKSDYDNTYHQRHKIVGVMGSAEHEHINISEPTGQLIAKLGCHLLTGGGSGVMNAISRAFHQTNPRSGMVIGVVKSLSTPQLINGERNYQPNKINPWVEIPIFTHLPLSGENGKDMQSRNHINILSADIIVALPGGHGTLSELELALEYKVPITCFIENQTIAGFNTEQLLSRYPKISIANNLGTLEHFIKTYL